MKTIIVSGIASVIILTCSCGLSIEEKSEQDLNRPPNIVMIISDDQAWNDYSFMEHQQIETPNLDLLAKHSLTFTRGYTTAPLCSPSLASIISGLHPHQHGITGNDPAFSFEGQKYQSNWRADRYQIFQPSINAFNSLPLLTKRLDSLNYLSLQTGKWWMGSWRDGHFTHGMTHGDPARDGRHGDEGLTIGRDGLQPIFDFIQHANEADKPFFVWYAPFLPHSPHNPPIELEEKYLKRTSSVAVAKYWAMCEWFDQTCGNLLGYLDEHNLTEETLIVYVCDNGWIQRSDQVNRYAPRSKRTPYEAGIRTPIMIKWPGEITPQLDSTTTVSAIDIVPTIRAACGLPIDANLPGVNLLDPQLISQRKTIFSAAYAHDIASLEQPTQSLQYKIGISYPWKLILPNSENLPDASLELYNIAEDPYEKLNQSETQPSELGKLKNELENWEIN